MEIAPKRHDEIESLSALWALGILDTAPEAEFDALVKVASLVCNVPISLISLIDKDRQWFKANVGLPGVTETPREVAFCAHAVLSEELFEVGDASKDTRFSDNPLVSGKPDIRFYAGAPICLSGGELIGTLCVIDTKPHKLNEDQRNILKQLSIAIGHTLESREVVLKIKDSTEDFAKSFSDLRIVIDHTPALMAYWNRDLTCRFANIAYEEWFGKRPEEMVGMNLSDLLGPELFALNKSFIEGALNGQVQRFERDLTLPNGEKRSSLANYIPDIIGGKVVGFLANVTDVTDLKNKEKELTRLTSLAEEANKAKGLFLANMSHEIRTPLSGILSTAELLSETNLSGPQKKIRRYCTSVR